MLLFEAPHVFADECAGCNVGGDPLCSQLRIQSGTAVHFTVPQSDVCAQVYPGMDEGDVASGGFLELSVCDVIDLEVSAWDSDYCPPSCCEEPEPSYGCVYGTGCPGNNYSDLILYDWIVADATLEHTSEFQFGAPAVITPGEPILVSVTSDDVACGGGEDGNEALSLVLFPTSCLSPITLAPWYGGEPGFPPKGAGGCGATMIEAVTETTRPIRWTTDNGHILDMWSQGDERHALIQLDSPDAPVFISAWDAYFADRSTAVYGTDSGCCGARGAPGSGEVNLRNSLDVRFSLGPATDRESAGLLHLFAEHPYPALTGPGALRYYLDRNDVDVYYEPAGVIRQLRTPNQLVDIDPNSATSYTIRYIPKEAVSDFGDPSGPWDATGAAVMSWSVKSDPFTVGMLANDQFTYDIVIKQYSGEILPANRIATHLATYSHPLGERAWTWTLNSMSPASSDDRETIESWSYSLVTAQWTQTVEVREGGVLTSADTYTYTQYEDRRLPKTHTPDASLTTTYHYYDENSNPPGPVAWIENWDGSWRGFDYEHAHDPNSGFLVLEVSSWCDDALPSGPPSVSQSRSVEHNYEGGRDDRPTLTIERVNNVVVGKTEWVHETIDECPVITERRYFANAAGQYLETITTYDASDPNHIETIEFPDHSLDTYTYERGSYAEDAQHPSEWSFTEGEGDYIRVTITHGLVGSPNGTAYKSTQERTVRDRWGRACLDEELVYTGSSHALVNWKRREYDAWGHVTDEYRANGAHVETIWKQCCGIYKTRDASSATTKYGFDPLLNRLAYVERFDVLVSRHGGQILPAQAAVRTDHTRSGYAGLVQTTTTVSSGDLESISVERRDLVGRLRYTMDPGGVETTYEYSFTGSCSASLGTGVFPRLG